MTAESTAFSFDISHRESGTPARRGKVRTAHGSFQTPAFMPVGTQGAVKGLQVDEVLATGAEIILANTYHLHLRPGEKLIESQGGLHEFMTWKGPILTDSGGYQVFSLSDLRTIDEEGVSFKSHLDGAPCRLSPQIAMEIQIALGSDIIMSFDECLPFPCDYDYAAESVDRTTRWEQRTLDFHPRDGRALFGIVQGGVFPELRARSAKDLLCLPFDGLAMGGLFVGEPRSETMDMLQLVAELIPKHLPRYVMGVGTPVEVLDCILRGWDMFDCVLPTRNARHGYALTFAGTVKLKNRRFREDSGPLEADCDCMACSRYSRSYLRHLFMSKEQLAGTLLSHHNLRFMQRVMAGARDAIAHHRLPSFRDEFARSYEGAVPDDF